MDSGRRGLRIMGHDAAFLAVIRRYTCIHSFFAQMLMEFAVSSGSVVSTPATIQHHTCL